MPKSVQIKESLSKQNLEEFGSQLKSLPTEEEFKEKTEIGLWETFVGEANSDDEVIEYEQLSENSKKLIGTISLNDETRVPWWLSTFEWTAKSTGRDKITVDKENLSKFQTFVPEQTTIWRPELANSNDIYKTLKNFKTVREEIEEHLDFEEAEDGLALPDNIFAKEDRKIRTSSEFQRWFDSLITLCPPFNHQLTALLMMNTRVKDNLAKEVLPDEVMQLVEDIGLINNGEIYNSDYFEPVASAPYSPHRIHTETLLKYDWDVFDLQVPYVDEEYDYLAPLEAALFESWVENNREVAKDYKKYLMNTRLSSGTEYPLVSFKTPITKERGKSKFVTLEQIKDKSLSASSARKKRDLKEILEKYGIGDD